MKIQGPFICHDRWPVPFIRAPLTDREILSDHCTHFPLSTCFPLGFGFGVVFDFGLLNALIIER